MADQLVAVPLSVVADDVLVQEVRNRGLADEFDDKSISDFSTDELRASARDRGLAVYESDGAGEHRHLSMLQAVLRGDDVLAMALLREHLCDYFGRAAL